MVTEVGSKHVWERLENYNGKLTNTKKKTRKTEGIYTEANKMEQNGLKATYKCLENKNQDGNPGGNSDARNRW